MRDQKHIYNNFQHVRTRPLSLNSALNQCPRAWQDSRQAPLMTVKLWVKKPSFADTLDYTRIHLALLLHMYMRRYESFALECAAVDECGDLGTSKSLEELSTKILTSPLAKLCDAVQCRAMSRQEMHSCKFWRQRRWRESRLAPLGSDPCQYHFRIISQSRNSQAQWQDSIWSKDTCVVWGSNMGWSTVLFSVLSSR